MSKTPQLLQYVIAIIIIYAVSAQINQGKDKSLTQNGLLNCTNSVRANLLETTLLNDITLNEAVFNSVSLGSITTNKANINTLITSKIIAKNDQETLYINSLLKVKGKVIYEQETQSESESDLTQKSFDKNEKPATSFVQLSGVTINNIHQWKQIESDIQLGDVNSKLNAFIVSNLLEKKNNVRFETEKTISLFKDRNIALMNVDVRHYKIEMTFHFDSLLWNGHKAYIKINNDLYWLDNHQWKSIPLSLEDCAKEGNYWQKQIKMIIPSKYIKGNSAQMKFGLMLSDKTNSINSLLSQCQIILSKVQDREIIYYDNIFISIK